uniref:Uncharacterized protein n=1 Tax=Zosterops lateralis melanops TaxID=1220523 RepID=A0A8D2QTW9_ZOSLA
DPSRVWTPPLTPDPSPTETLPKPPKTHRGCPFPRGDSPRGPIHPRDAEPIHPRDAEPIHPRDAEPIHPLDAEPVHPRDAEPVPPRDAEPKQQRGKTEGKESF